ncbi:HEPN domain-containing protein [Variovorax sp. 38R]|uniref:HEPN domain-containing protein n=1 Tax=Variovorax sp. 38R TaxID=2774875 RepID=UPI0017857BCB|nr:HEPN domain-containing protein [Variovorax sp. 38R]QOF76173.1 HEPN domain-containing protein [Variovorax sp. 38R]
MPKKIRLQSAVEAKSAAMFLNDAFTDYLAARILLNARMPHQGAMMASTALEKYFKAILVTRGQRIHGHLQTAHWNSVSHLYPALVAQLDRDFVRLCQKSYSLRYTDDLPKGYNIVIASREFLAELDTSVATIQKGVRHRLDGEDTQTDFDRHRVSGDERLVTNNHVLLGVEKFDFIYSEPQFVFEVRNHAHLDVLQITYEASGLPKTPGFLRPACLPFTEGNRHGLHLAFGDPKGSEPTPSAAA